MKKDIDDSFLLASSEGGRAKFQTVKGGNALFSCVSPNLARPRDFVIRRYIGILPDGATLHRNNQTAEHADCFCDRDFSLFNF